MEDDELDIELRAPAEVAERSIVLAALIRRLSIESLAGDRTVAGLAGEAFDLHAWLNTENLDKPLEDAELAFLAAELGSLDPGQMATVAWQTEGLATLGWALGLAELPPLGELTSVETILNAVPSPWDSTGSWISDAILRQESDIALERDRAELVEWRVSVEPPRRDSMGRERTEYEQAIDEVAKEAYGVGLAEFATGDLVLAEMPVATLNDNDLERFAALAEERLRALNWLCGFGDSWDRVPLDV